MQLSTMGYGRWPVASRLTKTLDALRRGHVDVLIDIRHSPCPSQVKEHPIYGPRPWHLQAGTAGLRSELKAANIDYLWLVELGNPQKVDPEMRVLREHLAQAGDEWPVQRGLRLLRQLVAEGAKHCCLLCACKDYENCHRKLIAEALQERLPGLNLVDLK